MTVIQAKNVVWFYAKTSLGNKGSASILCNALGVPHWLSFHIATFGGAQNCQVYKVCHLLLEPFHPRLFWENSRS